MIKYKLVGIAPLVAHPRQSFDHKTTKIFLRFMAFPKKKSNPLEIRIFFFYFENKDWGSNKSASWGQIKVKQGSNKSEAGVIYLIVHTQIEFVWPVKNLTPGALLFNLKEHFYLTLSPYF